MRRGGGSLAAAPCLLAAALAAAPGSPQRGLQPDDLFRLQSVGEVQISPDGRRILYQVLTSAEKGPPRSRPWLIDMASGRRKPVPTACRAAWSFRWSPDGRRLAYRCALPDGSGLVVAHGDGSGASVVARITDTNHPLPARGEALAWAPSATSLAFLSATPGPEGPAPDEADPIVVSRYLYKPATGPRLNDNRRLHVFIVDLVTKSIRQLTDGPHHDHSLAWSPRGDEIAFGSNRGPQADRVFNDDLFAVRVRDGAVRRITETPSAEYAPAWSPDGRPGVPRNQTPPDVVGDDHGGRARLRHGRVGRKSARVRCGDRQPPGPSPLLGRWALPHLHGAGARQRAPLRTPCLRGPGRARLPP